MSDLKSSDPAFPPVPTASLLDDENASPAERLLFRQQLRKDQRYIVDTIFPAGSLHLLGGPSGYGKSTWLFQQLHQWSRGEQVLGYNSHPCPWVYVSCDRPTAETDRTLCRIGLKDWEVPIWSVEECLTRNAMTGHLEGEPTIYRLVEKFPKAELIVIEGLQSLLPDTMRGRTQNKSELLWMIQLRDLILSKGKTIIATTHTVKGSEQKFTSRGDFLGSASLIGAVSTMIHFDITPTDRDAHKNKSGPIESDDRLVTIMGHNFPKHLLSYTRDEQGRFIHQVTMKRSGATVVGEVHQTIDDHEIALDTHLAMWPTTTPLPTQEIESWAEKHMVPRRTFFRWLKARIEQGMLRREKRGEYVKLRPA